MTQHWCRWSSFQIKDVTEGTTNKNKFAAAEPVRPVREMLMVYPLNISAFFIVFCQQELAFRAVYPSLRTKLHFDEVFDFNNGFVRLFR